VTDYITHVVRQGNRFRVAIAPVSQGGASPIVATAWAEQDGRVFEADTYAEAEAFIGQMSERFWKATSDVSSVLVDFLSLAAPVPPGVMPGVPFLAPAVAESRVTADKSNFKKRKR
jgi:hypothetical protein